MFDIGRNLASPDMTVRAQQACAALLRAGALVLRFLLMFFLARSLPLKDVGLFGLYWAALQLSASLLTLDVYAYTTRKILRPHADRLDIIRSHTGLVCLAVVVGCPTIGVVLLLTSSDLGQLLAWIFVLHLPFELFATDVGRLLIPLGKPLAANGILFVRSAFWIFPVIILLETEIYSTVFFVCLFWVAGSAGGAVIGLIILRNSLGGAITPKFDRGWIKSAVFASSSFFAATLTFRAILGADRLLVASLLGLEALGIYTLFASAALGALSLLESGISAWRYPDLVREIDRGQVKRVRIRLRQFVVENTVATIVLMAMITAGTYAATIIFLARPYQENIEVLFIISASVAIYCVSLPCHYVLYGFQRNDVMLYIYIGSLAAMTSWAVFLMEPLGVVGAGVMLLIALALIAIGRIVAAIKMLHA